MLAAYALKGTAFPRGGDLWRTALNGVLILGVGNGCLVLAETWIPSGLAALIITISPFWMLGLDAVLPPRSPLHAPTLAGMGVGLCGAALLVGPGAFQGGLGGNITKGFLVLQLGCLAWTSGSLLQRKRESPANPFVNACIQQLAAGVAFIVPALVTGGDLHVNARGVSALFYLVTFGSIVGYSSYVYALEHLPVPVVSIYNYVNPVVAVTLGWLFYREPFGLRDAIAMAVIFAGVAMVKRAEARRVRP